MEIAVLGGGNGAYAAAADLAEAGHAVRFWRRDEGAFAPVIESGSVGLRDVKGTRRVPLSLVTTDIAAALLGAELVVVPLPATAQAGMADLMAPHLEDGQVVFLPPGTFGSYWMARRIRDRGNTRRLIFAETGTLPWLARMSAHDTVTITVRATRLPTGVFPASAGEAAFPVLERAFPAVERLSDALDGALMNAGPIIHPPLILMNAGPLEAAKGDFDIHNEGTQPAIRAVTTALDAERMAVRTAFGYGPPHFPLADHYDPAGEEWMYGRAAHERLVESQGWREPVDLRRHRYMREDVVIGLAFLISAGAWAGVFCPVASSLLTLAGVILDEDLRRGLRTMEAMALSDLTRGELTRLLRDGLS